MARRAEAKVTPAAGRTGRRPHRHLIDPGKLILHRILHGDNLAIGPIELLQASVERGCLAGSRRAGDKDNAVGKRKQLAQPRGIIRKQAEGVQPRGEAVAIENADHD
jgi:hypothetical protein